MIKKHFDTASFLFKIKKLLFFVFAEEARIAHGIQDFFGMLRFEGANDLGDAALDAFCQIAPLTGNDVGGAQE